MRPTRALIASCALAALPAITHAAVVQYTFEVVIFEGPLVDTLWEGEFSFTTVDSEGRGVSVPLDMLTFDFNGQTYNNTDDDDFPTFPIAIFSDGEFVGIDFLVLDAFDGNVPLVDFRVLGDSFFYNPITRDGDEGDVFGGDVFYFLVPTPGSAALIGLAALAGARRRRA